MGCCNCLFYKKILVVSLCQSNVLANCHSAPLPAAGFLPGFLVCLSRWWHKRLFQKLPKTRLLCCERFYVIKLGQLGSFWRLCHRLLRLTRKPDNETCRWERGTVTVLFTVMWHRQFTFFAWRPITQPIYYFITCQWDLRIVVKMGFFCVT